MEITSLHWSGSQLPQEHAQTARTEKQKFVLPSETRAVFEVPDAAVPELDYSAISPRLLREVALQKYVTGKIEQDVYIALAQELPMEAVDSTGQVLDLSTVTDDTEFNFEEYYREQRDLAAALGDEDKASTLNSVLGFLNA
ncbi:hypothetical protein [Rhizobium sp. FY34]|uniref:hypothetical protein n=1 Tax=Rhizobium sp. FY34 TaxID=2562309 RepID=UPI0010C0DDA3|nr:hypothetical protein [Rhizobium sp. FY34]